VKLVGSCTSQESVSSEQILTFFFKLIASLFSESVPTGEDFLCYSRGPAAATEEWFPAVLGDKS